MSEALALVLDGGLVSIRDVERVARDRIRVHLGSVGTERLRRSRAALEGALEAGDPIYGVNTGFGSLARVRIADDELRGVQRNLILSHASGVGDPLPEDVVRAMVLLLAASLTRGLSGVRPLLVEALLTLLNQGVTPVVPSIGSVGASGDLAPLAHSALLLIGEGDATFDGRRLSGRDALAQAGLEPIELLAKEGLALINGTHLMAGIGALALADLERTFAASLAAAAMSIDAARGTDAFLDERVHLARGQAGQSVVAARLSELIAGSEIVPSHLHDDPRVQDPYSLRCAPQVLGAALDTIDFARGLVERELAAVTDNPLVFLDGGERAVVSAGNFHGMPLAVAFDALKMAMTYVAGIAERRVYYLLAASDAQNPLHPQLSPQPGLHSGLMITQYVAAACVNELSRLSSPASVVNVPTSAGMEDFNSFGANAALQARLALDRLTEVVAIELLCAAEALEYQRPLRSGAGVEAAHAIVRSVVSKRTADRPPAPDIARIVEAIRAGRFANLPA